MNEFKVGDIVYLKDENEIVFGYMITSIDDNGYYIEGNGKRCVVSKENIY